MKSSEDTQPNEVRLSRKGSTSIPTIRNSAHPTKFGGPLRNTGHRRGAFLPPQAVSRPRMPLGRGTTVASFLPARPFPQPFQLPDSNFKQPHKRPSSRQDAREASKRQRLHHLPPRTSFTDNTDIIPHQKPLLTGHISEETTGKDLVHIYKAIPAECSEGAPQCNAHRSRWIRRQTKALEIDSDLIVINQSYEGSIVHFQCRHRPMRRITQVATSPNDKVIISASMNQNHSGFEGYDVSSSRSDGRFHLLRESRTGSSRLSSDDGHNSRVSVCSVDTSATAGDAKMGYRDQPAVRKLRHQPAMLSQVSADAKSCLNDADDDKINSRRCYVSSPTLGLVGSAPSLQDSQIDVSTNPGPPFCSKQNNIHETVRRFSSGRLLISPPRCILPDIPSVDLPVVRSSPSSNSESTVKPRSTCQSDKGSLRTSQRKPAVARTMQRINYPGDGQHVKSARGASFSVTDIQPGHGSRHTQFANEVVRFPRDTYDRPRRTLIIPALGVVSITMHGRIVRTERCSPRQVHLLRPEPEGRQSIDDACLLRSSNSRFMLLGFAQGAHELSVTRVKPDKVTDIAHLDRPIKDVKKGGISAVCSMMQPLMFATGGYDHGVHLWDASADITRPSSTHLDIKHTSLVQSLLPLRDTSHKLISAGADCNVHVYDLSSERVVNTLQTSNSVYHVHEVPNPFCTLLEVAHKELQFEIRDHRLVPEKPVQRFGHQMNKVQGRYARGDTNLYSFACGDRDGSVRFWDLRNTASPRIIPCFPGQRVTQVIFNDAYLTVCSEEHEVLFLQHGLGIS